MMTIVLLIDLDTRALFERALNAIPPQRAQRIWGKYVEYESQYGDLNNLQKLQERRNQSISHDKIDLMESVVNLGEKWSFFDINYVAQIELGTQG